MSSLKPQVLPYTKKGIFGNVAQQGLSGIGMKVGQSVSGLWSSLSAGIASNLLNRSLGLSNEDVAKMNSANAAQQVSGAGTNIADSGVISDVSKLEAKTNERKKQLADSKAMVGRTSISGNEMTLIDDELETLYAKFQEKRVDLAKSDDDGGRADWVEAERKAQKLRREEMKVRALNRNGRVDYSIQDPIRSVLDFNPMNTIASHMSYWSDEDDPGIDQGTPTGRVAPGHILGSLASVGAQGANIVGVVVCQAHDLQRLGSLARREGKTSVGTGEAIQSRRDAGRSCQRRGVLVADELAELSDIASELLVGVLEEVDNALDVALSTHEVVGTGGAGVRVGGEDVEGVLEAALVDVAGEDGGAGRGVQEGVCDGGTLGV
ncbi:DDHD domain-containing protein [Colletotrichum higginsianum]|nr:DDHD domain-containing protein [Colletotrichum higginsianum]